MLGSAVRFRPLLPSSPVFLLYWAFPLFSALPSGAAGAPSRVGGRRALHDRPPRSARGGPRRRSGRLGIELGKPLAILGDGPVAITEDGVGLVVLVVPEGNEIGRASCRGRG